MIHTNSVYSEKYKLQYRDINQFGKLSDLAIIQLLQDMAGKHSSSLGYGFNDINKTHITWLLLGWRLKKITDIFSEEEIKIETWSSKAEKATFYREFKIYNSKNELAIIADSKWVAINVETHSILRDSNTISHLVETYNSFNSTVFDIPYPKIKTLDIEPNSTFNYTFLRKDIDTNNHVNNTVYLSLALEAIPEEIFKNFNYSNLEILYKHEALLGDNINCKYYVIDENSFVVSIHNAIDDKLHATIKYTK